MGRDSTGAITVGQCLQLNVNHFSKHLKDFKGPVSATLTWSSGACMSISLIKQVDQYRLTLNYTHTREGVKKEISYHIYIVSCPSNLGKGEVYYFLCPFKYQRCRVLYMGYGSQYFKSRSAYSHRLYYPCQMSSPLDRHNDSYWRLERLLDKVDYKRLKSHYKGKETRTQKKLEAMRKKRAYHDEMRWKILPKAVLKSIFQFGLQK